MKDKPPAGATTLIARHPPEALDRHGTPPRQTSSPLKFKLILVPVDFSSSSVLALDYALVLGEKFGSRLVLLHVVEPAGHPDSYLLNAVLDETNANLLQAAREHLAAFCRKRVGHRLVAESLVRMGHAISEIPDTAKALGVDLIVVGAHAHSRTQGAALESTAERLLRQAACPVLTVPAPDAGSAAPDLSK